MRTWTWAGDIRLRGRMQTSNTWNDTSCAPGCESGRTTRCPFTVCEVCRSEPFTYTWRIYRIWKDAASVASSHRLTLCHFLIFSSRSMLAELTGRQFHNTLKHANRGYRKTTAQHHTGETTWETPRRATWAKAISCARMVCYSRSNCNCVVSGLDRMYTGLR